MVYKNSPIKKSINKPNIKVDKLQAKLIYKYLFVSLVCILFSRVTLLGQLTPFIYAFTSYIVLCEKKLKFIPILSCIALYFMGNTNELFSYAVYYIIVLLASLKIELTAPTIIKILVSVLGAIISAFITSYMMNNQPPSPIHISVQCIIILCTYFVYATSYKFIFNSKEQTTFKPSLIISLSIFTSILCASFGTLSLFGINIGIMSSIFFILCAGYYFTLEGSLSLSILSALMLIVCCSRWPSLIMIFSLSALFSSLVTSYGKLAYIVVFITVLGASSFISAPLHQIISTVSSASLASFSFLIVSHYWADAYIGKQRGRKNTPYVMNEAVNMMIKDSIELQKSMVNEVAKNIAITTNLTDENRTTKICKEVSADICISCPHYNRCWKLDTKTTFELLENIISSFYDNSTFSFKEVDIKFKQRCSNNYTLYKSISYLVDLHNINKTYQAKMLNFKRLILVQYKHLNNVLDRFYQQLSNGIYISSEDSIVATTALQNEGIAIEKTFVVKDFNKANKIFVRSEDLLEDKTLQSEIVMILSDALNRSIKYDYSYRRDCNGGYIYTYCERTTHSLSIGIVNTSKEGEHCSGDKYSNNILANGLHMIAICDGMGSGTSAAKQSERVLNMLEELLNSSCDEITSINVINNILTLEENTEVFSTLDLLLFDLNKGVGEFVKAGAAPSYIRRGDEITKMEFDSLPIGIVKQTNINKGLHSFNTGDLIYLMSDGFFDSYEDNEKIILDKLREHSYRNPQRIADELLADIRNRSRGKLCDDITIMVIKVR